MYMVEREIQLPDLVMSISFLNLRQFYKISQNWWSSCTKMIASSLKVDLINKKSTFLHTAQNLSSQISKMLDQFHGIQP